MSSREYWDGRGGLPPGAYSSADHLQGYLEFQRANAPKPPSHSNSPGVDLPPEAIAFLAVAALVYALVAGIVALYETYPDEFVIGVGGAMLVGGLAMADWARSRPALRAGVSAGVGGFLLALLIFVHAVLQQGAIPDFAGDKPWQMALLIAAAGIALYPVSVWRLARIAIGQLSRGLAVGWPYWRPIAATATFVAFVATILLGPALWRSIDTPAKRPSQIAAILTPPPQPHVTVPAPPVVASVPAQVPVPAPVPTESAPEPAVAPVAIANLERYPYRPTGPDYNKTGQATADAYFYPYLTPSDPPRIDLTADPTVLTKGTAFDYNWCNFDAGYCEIGVYGPNGTVTLGVISNTVIVVTGEKPGGAPAPDDTSQVVSTKESQP